MDIVCTLQKCFIKISELIRFSNSFDLGSKIDLENTSGDSIKKLDFVSNNILINEIKKLSCIKYICSEEEDDIIINNEEGEYLISFDPVDGSSNIKNNITVGTIFCVFKCNDNKIISGKNIYMSGYCLYGNSTIFVLSFNNTTNIYILDKYHKFNIIKNSFTMPKIGNSYAVNESNKDKWVDPKIIRIIDKMINHNKTQRWVGSLVADAHRVLVTGGLFMYPSDTKNKNGKIRLLYEAFPMAYIFYSCGGYSSDGKDSILDLEINLEKNIHQKIPIYLFSKSEYELFQLC